ncbi:MAG: acyl-CoA desaturase [Acidiferrobacteraceae bacterium]|nr:acyl-CoA desaturase [Acidiferrobacteraceae bacterium]
MQIPLLDSLAWWVYLIIVLSLTHITIISVTVFLHRHQAHRALSLHPIASHIFRFWLWLTTGIVTREWVAVHRKHHARVETEDDPHSPQVVGILNVLFGGLFLYQRESRNHQTLRDYGSGVPDDWIERNLYTSFRGLGIVVMLSLNIIFFGLTAGLAIWIVQMIWIPFWAAGVINGLAHWTGYRNYELPDASHNLTPIGILIGGEELHNNHHAFASSAKFSARRFEIDIGWVYIQILKTLRLAAVHKTKPSLVQRGSRSRCDIETLRAVLVGRFDITSRFTKEVLQTVCREEAQRGTIRRNKQRAVLNNAIKLVQQESRGLSATAKRHLHTALELSPRLATSYAAKRKLQDIWNRSTINSEGLVQQLEEWCNNAENSGIEALRNFSIQLRGYRLIDR